MRVSLEPIVLKRQDCSELMFPPQIGKMERMAPSLDERKEFAERINKVLDAEGWPERGRQTRLGKLLGVSQKAAGKWLNAETMPELKRIPEIARKFNLNIEWLLSGRGPMRLEPVMSQEERVLVEKYRQMDEENRKTYQTVGDAFASARKSKEGLDQSACASGDS